jgi:hypothetical protein
VSYTPGTHRVSSSDLTMCWLFDFGQDAWVSISSSVKMGYRLGTLVHVCNPSIWEVEVGGS